MKPLFFLLAILTVTFAAAPLFAEEELLDRVIAVVNDEIITQAELDAVLRPLYEDYKEQYSSEELSKLVKDARQKILSQLIEDKLVYQEAVAQNVEVKDEEIDKELDEFKKRMAPAGDMDSLLEKEGMTMKTLRDKLKKQVMIRKLQDMEIRSKIVVSPVEIEAFYQSNPDKFVKTGRVKVKSLTVKKSKEAREKGIVDEKAKEKIESLYKQARQGGNFDEMVKTYSEDSRAKEGSPAQWIEKGSMIESMDELLFKTPEGKLTEIVESPIGFHIFRIEEKEDARQVSLKEARDQIANYLFQVKSNERFKEWLEQLKKTAYISIR